MRTYLKSTAGLAMLAVFAATNVCGVPLFVTAPGSPVNVGSRPTGVAVGDFNGDGKQDLAVANALNNNVTVLLGNGAGGFAVAPGSPVTVGSFPYAIIAKDFNHDGKTDLAVVNSLSNNVTILLGNGAGGFASAPGSPFAVGTNPDFATTADFNGDTIPDLAVTNYLANTVTVLLGNGAGGFTPAPGSPYATGNAPQGVVALDLNKDGKMDLAIANQLDNHVTTLLGNGAGGFVAGTSNEGASHATIITGQANIFGMTTGDFYSRGTTDAVTASFGANQVNLLKSDGVGDILYNAQFSAVNSPINVVSGDFDGDGKLDIAVVCEGTDQLLILLGNGAGNFNVATAPFFSTGGNPYGLATGDFNGDGKLDIVVTNQNDHTISVLLSNSPVAPPPAVLSLPSSQTIDFNIGDHVGSDAAFLLQATASSGLPVSFTVQGGPATVSGDLLTVTGLGTVTVVASQAGSSSFLPASATQSFNIALGSPSIRVLVNGASLRPGVVPPGSYATIFGSNLVSGAFQGDSASSQTLGGTTVTILDVQKKSFTPNLSLVSFGQINFVVPADVAAGPATVTVTNKTGKFATVSVTIGPVAPALFSADGSGSGGAAANITAPDGSPTLLPTSSCLPFGCTLKDISLPSGLPVYLILYGTGIRGRSGLHAVSLSIGDVPAKVTYAGAQGNYAGLDQVDALLPASLAGAGTVDVKLTVDGISANPVKIRFK